MYSFLAKSAKPFALKTHLKSDVKFSIAEGKWDPPRNSEAVFSGKTF